MLTCSKKTGKVLTLKLTAVLIKAYQQYWHYRKCLIVSLTLFRMRGRGAKKARFTSFSPAISTNVRINPQNFLNFSLTLLTDWCEISSFYLAPLPNDWAWSKTTPEKRFFWWNPYKIEVMINSLLQMLEIPNFHHMTTSTT